MSEATPFETLPGLTAIGDDDDAGMCVDGVCAMPTPASPAQAESPVKNLDAQD